MASSWSPWRISWVSRNRPNTSVLFLYKTVPKEGHWRKKDAATARFYFCFLPFSHWKWSYFEVLIKFKKNGHTICESYRIFEKIFSLRHHGVKSFWTKVGGFPPMPLWLRLKSHGSDSLSALFTKELLWANLSHRSLQKSDREQFVLFQEWIAILIFCSQKTIDSLKKPKSEFPTLVVRHKNMQ